MGDERSGVPGQRRTLTRHSGGGECSQGMKQRGALIGHRDKGHSHCIGMISIHGTHEEHWLETKIIVGTDTFYFND